MKTALKKMVSLQTPNPLHRHTSDLYYTCVTILAMEKTLTIRLTKDQDRSLTRRARALGKTRSEVVRELIEKGLDEERLGRKIAHLKGILSISNPEDPVRRRIKERNWR